MTMSDYYEILQVSAKAEPEVIQAAYKRLAFKYHPDRNAAPSAHQMMTLLNKAYAILSDPIRRSAYDRLRRKTKPEPKQKEAQNDQPKQKGEHNEQTANRSSHLHKTDVRWVLPMLFFLDLLLVMLLFLLTEVGPKFGANGPAPLAFEALCNISIVLLIILGLLWFRVHLQSLSE
jgi:curved DNA-binding protein CbpA